MNVSRTLSGKWLYKSGEVDRCETVIICDSQGKGPCQRPGSFVIPDKAVVFAINGGSLRDVREILRTAPGREARFVVIAGLGTNDLSALGNVEPAPPRVKAMKGPAGARQCVFEAGPSTVEQRPRHDPDIKDHARYESILARYDEIHLALWPNQVLITMTPIARRSKGFINFQLSLLEARIKRISDHHHHINNLQAFVATARKKSRGEAEFGGKWVSKDTKFRGDDVHLVDRQVQMVLDAIDRAIADIRPDKRKKQEGKIFLSSGAHFRYVF